ncbi:hypothetical protein T492DRAFT_57114 [Pavlovales sp. CCMP2436]|nr:hypothetical protein T492DRAFT_57114 [Pavlovales sp. CCMP2436]
MICFYPPCTSPSEPGCVPSEPGCVPSEPGASPPNLARPLWTRLRPLRTRQDPAMEKPSKTAGRTRGQKHWQPLISWRHLLTARPIPTPTVGRTRALAGRRALPLE